MKNNLLSLLMMSVTRFEMLWATNMVSIIPLFRFVEREFSSNIKGLPDFGQKSISLSSSCTVGKCISLSIVHKSTLYFSHGFEDKKHFIYAYSYACVVMSLFNVPNI